MIYHILQEKGRLDLLDKYNVNGTGFQIKRNLNADNLQEESVGEQVYGEILKENDRLSVEDQVYEYDQTTPGETEQLLTEVLTEAGEDEAWYNTLMGPSTINGVKENKYSAWANTGEIISPQTGDLTMKFNDITLPGRNGLDLTLGRMYQSSQALLGDWRFSTFERYQNGFSSYYQDRYDLGVGWSFTFPSVQVETDMSFSHNEYKELYYHTGNGDIYHVNFTADPNDSNLEDYYKKDGVFKEDTSYSYTDGAGGSQEEQIVSKYVFETGDKTKQYFAADGRLMAIVDRFGNQITFKHNLYPVTNRVVNYDFDDTDLSGIPWTYDEEDYFLGEIGRGVDDETSLVFVGDDEDASALSKPIKVHPSTKYYISGYLSDQLSRGTAYVKIRQYSVWVGLHWDEHESDYYIGPYMDSNPDNEIVVASSDYNDREWRKFEQFFTTEDDTQYIQIEFYNDNPWGPSWLDKVRLDQAHPLITEITDSIGREITFDYVDNFYEEGEELYDYNPITVTVTDPAQQNNKVFTYNRETRETVSNTYKFKGVIDSAEYYHQYPDNPLISSYTGHRRYPELKVFDDGETEHIYYHDGTLSDFSFWDKDTEGDYGRTGYLLLERAILRNSRVYYDYNERASRHLGEEGFYSKYRVTTRDERYYINGTWDEGGHYLRNYSYDGYYNGNYYYNETGYSQDYYSSYTLPEDPGFQWISTMEQENGLTTETHFKGSSIGLREEKEVTYHSGGEKETTYFEEYDTTFPNQVTRVKTERENAGGIYTLYTGYTYNDWGGLASETKPLTPAQWNDPAVKSQNTVSYTYDPVYKLPATTTYYQNPGAQLTESIIYNTDGAVLTTTNAKGETTTCEYGDAAHKGNCTRMVTNLEQGKQAITEYDYSGAYYAYPTTITQKYTEDGIVKNSTITKGYEFIRVNVVSETDPSGTTQYQYDDQGRIQTVTYPLATGKDGAYTVADNYQYADLVPDEYGGRRAFRVYKYTTKTVSGQSPVTIAQSYDYYDDYGNLLVSEYWDNDRSILVRTKYQYDNYGQLVWIKDAQDRQTNYEIDEWGRVETITDPQSNTYRYQYDIYHNTKTTSFIPQGGTEENQYVEAYDQRGRTISRKGYPEGIGGSPIEETYAYDLADNLVQLTDARNKITQFQYDALDNLTKVINALEEETDYDYNKLGKLSKIDQYQDAQTFENSKAYDERGALISTQRPSGPPVTYRNNALGLPVQVTDASGKIISLSYDGSNRVSETTANHDGISRYYHPLGSVEKYTVWNDAGGTRVYGEGLEYDYYYTGLTKERKSGAYTVGF